MVTLPPFAGAASVLVTFATELYRNGISDIGFIMVMSVAAVITLAIVAPKRFTTIRGGARDWDDETPYKPASEND